MDELNQLEEQYKQKILSYKDMVAKGEMTEAEYKELVEDLLDVQLIENKLKSEELKTQAVKIAQALKVVAGLI